MILDEYNIPDLPARPDKPRERGLTHMLDKGLSARQAEDVLAVGAAYIDLVKLGWGTAVITPNLRRKLEVYQSADMPVYFGGTLFEVFFLRNQLDTYRRLLDDLSVEYLEISDGSVSMAQEEKLDAIRTFAQDFRVLSEVGSKDANNIMPPYESRESGTAGLFRPNGEIRSGLVDEIVARVNPKDIIFEAPNKMQQVWFIKHQGANVNLGNVAPEEVIPVETLRLGLRGDTLFTFRTPGVSASLSNGAHGDGAERS